LIKALFGRAPSGSGSTAENTVATLGAASLPPLLLSHIRATLFIEAAEPGLGGSAGSALQWRYSARAGAGAGAGGSPPKQA